MTEEVKNIAGYAIRQSCKIGGKDVMLGENENKCSPRYVVALLTQKADAIYPDFNIVNQSDDYLTMLSAYGAMIQQQTQVFKARQGMDGIESTIIDPAILNMDRKQNYTGKLICLTPDALKPEYRTQGYQVILAENGFGCKPDSNGRKIFGVEVATGISVVYSRSEVLGVLDADKYPAWVQEKMKSPQYRLDTKTGTWERLQSLHLLCPLHAEISEINKYGDYEDQTDYYGSLIPYQDQILEMIAGEHLDQEEERGLMTYFYSGEGDEVMDSIERKVWYYYPTVTVVNSGTGDELYGLIECWLREPLNKEEMERFKEEVSGQLSDGWGEGFEQRPIETDDGELYVSFWSSDDRWALTEESSSMEQHQESWMSMK